MMKRMMRRMMGRMMRPVMGGGPVVPVLPAGAIGYWRGQNYTVGRRAYIPSTINPGPPPLSLLGPSRRLFANGNLWSGFGSTIVDDAALDDDGVMQASTVSGTGNWRIPMALNHTFPAGTYTASATVMRNAGSNQSFAFTMDNTTTRSTAKTAGAAFTRETYTFTHGADWPSSYVSICSVDGSTGAELILQDFTLHAGASDLGPEPMGLNLVLGGTAYDTLLPPMADGELDLTDGGYGYIQMAEALTMTECTTVALINIESPNSFHAWLSKIQQWQNFAAHIDSMKQPYSSLGSNFTFDNPGMFTLAGCGWHTVTHVGSETDGSLWLDGNKMFSRATGMSASAIRDLWFGLLSSQGFPMDGYWRAMAIWDRALDDAECVQAGNALLADAGIARTPSRLYFATGDSLTSADWGYNYLYPVDADPVCTGRSFATGGATIQTLIDNAAALDAAIAARMPGQSCVLSVLIGTNGLADYPGGNSVWLASLAGYVDDRRAAADTPGLEPLKIVGITLPPNDRVGFNTARNVVNPVLRTWVGTHFDAIADFAADPNVGQDGDELDPLKYRDGVHPTTATHIVFKGILKPAVESV